jgi:phage-related minor tail protein
MIDLKAKLDKIDGESFNKLKEFGDKQKEIDQAQAAFAVKKDSMTEAEFNKDNEAFTLQKSKLAIQIEDEKSSLAVKKAQAVETILLTEEARKNLEYTKENANIAKTLTKEERDQADAAAKKLTATSSALNIKDRDAKTSEQAFIVSSAALDKEISINKIAQDNLSLQAQLGMLDDESLRTKLNLLKVEELKLEQTKQLTAAQRAYNQEIEKLDRDKAAAGGTYVGEKKADDETARARLLENYGAQRSAILLVTDAQIKSAQVMADTTNRQLAYTEMFKQGFKGMEDAIVNFTKTGKLSFKDMINSFIEGLLRYEIQQQQIALFSGMGGAGGLAKMFMGALGFRGPQSLNMAGDMVTGYQGEAKGGVYDAGLRTFAKGGMFTNSIVSQPTLFKFAKGTGLMGEAGPEAIMPLKRDSNGNLGVRSGGGSNVDVVVNNYGSEKATTKETVDSRGNRRIEVMIGDMVAGELNRVGSNTQQAMTASYGTSPLVARR